MDYAAIRKRREECRISVCRLEEDIEHLNRQAVELEKKMLGETDRHLNSLFDFLDDERIGHVFDISQKNVTRGFPAGLVVKYDIVDLALMDGCDNIIDPRQAEVYLRMKKDYREEMERWESVIDSIQADSTALLDEIIEATVIEIPFNPQYRDYAVVMLSDSTHEYYMSCGMDMITGLYGPLGMTKIHRNERPEKLGDIRSSAKNTDLLVCYNPSLMVDPDTLQDYVCRAWQSVYDKHRPDTADARKAGAGKGTPSRENFDDDFVERLMMN